MMFLERAVLVLCVAIAVNTFLNSFFLYRAKNVKSHVENSISVLLPLRNESHNVTALIESMQRQVGLGDVHFYLIDDNSTDKTRAIAVEAIGNDSRFSIIDGAPLPADWLGKPFALQQGFLRSTSEVIVVIDADVRLSAHAISRSVAILYELRFDFLSCYPKQIAPSISARLIQPLLQWSWIATVPLRIAEHSSRPSLAVANGQFFVVRRGALQGIGGFQSVKHEVLDDVKVARNLRRSGYQGSVIEGSHVASCQMYTSWRELRSGYGKSLHTAFGGPIGNTLAILFLIFTGILPFVLCLTGSAPAGVLAFIAILFSRYTSAKLTDGRILDSIFHPMSSLLAIYLIIYSLTFKKRITWKGRSL